MRHRQRCIDTQATPSNENSNSSATNAKKVIRATTVAIASDPSNSSAIKE